MAEAVKVESPRIKLVDPSSGIQVIKGSIAKDANFIQAVTASYTNLTHNPAALIIGAILLFSYLAIEAGQPTPFRQIYDRLNEIVGDANAARWEVSLAKVFAKVFDLILRYEKQVIVIGFAWIPVLVKPSTNSIFIAIAHSFATFILRDWHTFTFILLANAHLIYVSVRNPMHKLFVIVLTIAVFFVGVEVGGKPIYTPTKATGTASAGVASPTVQRTKGTP